MRRTALAAVVLAASGVWLMATDRPATHGPGASADAGTPAAAPQLNESAADRMPLAEFKRLFDASQVVVVDVRGTSAYRDGHVPGAVSVPLDTVGRRAGEWKGETKPVVTYCS